MVKAMALEFLSCKITISSFVVDKHLGRDTLRLWYYTISPQRLPTDFSILPQVILATITIMVLPGGDLVFPSFLLYILIGILL